MEKKIIILHYEKSINPDEIERSIKNEFPDCEIINIDSREKYIEALKTDVYDVILSESNQQHFVDVISDFKLAKAITPHTAFILLSPLDREISKDKSGKYKELKKITRVEPNILALTISRALEKVYLRQDISRHWG